VKPEVRKLVEGVLRYARQTAAEAEAGKVPPLAVERVRGFIVGTMETLRGLDHLTTEEWREWAPTVLSETYPRPTDADLSDPSYAPPARISEEHVRRYERVVTERLRAELAHSGSAARPVSRVELRGSRPETRLALYYRDMRQQKDLAWTFKLWESGYPHDDAPWTGTLSSPDDLVGSIMTDWLHDYWAHAEIAPA
jgi:hypothetical protein